MWSVQITEIQKVESGDRITCVITATYTNSTTGETRVLTHSALTEDGLKDTVRNNLRNLNFADTLIAKSEALKTSIDLAEPTDSRTDGEKNFERGVYILRQYDQAIKLGIRSETSTAHPLTRTVAQLRVDLSTGLTNNPEWIKYIN